MNNFPPVIAPTPERAARAAEPLTHARREHEPLARLFGGAGNPVRAREYESMQRVTRRLQGALEFLFASCGTLLIAGVAIAFFGLASGLGAGATGILGGVLAGLAIPMYVACGLALWVLTPMLVLGQAPYTATAISRERETGTWEILRTTPLTTWEIIGGKFAAGALDLPGRPVFVALGLVQGIAALVIEVFIAFILYSPPQPLMPAMLYVLLAFAAHAAGPACALASAASISTFISTLSRSSGTALPLAYSVLAFTHILPLSLGPLLAIVGAMLFGGYWLGVALALLFAGPLLTPVYALLAGVLLAATVFRARTLD